MLGHLLGGDLHLFPESPQDGQKVFEGSDDVQVVEEVSGQFGDALVHVDGVFRQRAPVDHRVERRSESRRRHHDDLYVIHDLNMTPWEMEWVGYWGKQMGMGVVWEGCGR